VASGYLSEGGKGKRYVDVISLLFFSFHLIIHKFYLYSIFKTLLPPSLHATASTAAITTGR
jgi:hypothetical protein